MILVTGGSGNIGSRLVRRLVARGPVRAMVLPGDPHLGRIAGLDGCSVFLADITRPETLVRALDGVETVFHLAGVVLAEDVGAFERVNAGGTRNMVRAAREAGVEHFVFVSSASVVYPRTTPYSRSKRQAERLVRERLPGRYTIVRPTLVYEENGAEEFLIFAQHLRRWPVVPLVGRGAARKNPVFVEDLVNGLVAVAGNRTVARGKTYALCGGEEVTLRELARLMMQRQGRRRPLVPLPVSLCRVVARALRLIGGGRSVPLAEHTIAGLTQDAALDPSSAARDLGYDPIGVREGLARCFPGGIPRRAAAAAQSTASVAPDSC